jgi:thioredoxin reductase (NADPH)
VSNKVYDLVIIGAGPSALTAAIYTTREDISTLLVEKGVIGGLMATIDKIENYPGFPNGIEGLTLAMDFQAQAEKFGAEIKLAEVTNLAKNDGVVKITTDDGEVMARAILIATGNDYRKLGIPGEAEFYGNGVHYCATCDGAFYRDKKLVVIGGANAAVQEAMFLTKFATHIDLVVRSHIKATEILQKELAKYVKEGKITVHEGVTPDEIVADNGQVTAVTAHQTAAPSNQQKFATDGVFIFAGVIPNTGFLAGSAVQLDNAGHIITDQNLMTNLPGVFASGDVRSGATKQVTAATGEGTTAALAIREYLTHLGDQ